MTTLSPAAQAVLDAYRKNWTDEPLKQDVKCMAAALRAVADQVVPVPTDQDLDRFDFARTHARCHVRGQILAIAAELDSQEATP